LVHGQKVVAEVGTPFGQTVKGASMTTTDQLREWTKADEAFAMSEQGITD
jgi:hypothetical protein